MPSSAGDEHAASGESGEDIPFGELFPPVVPDEPWRPTGRTAAMLHVALQMLADYIEDDVVTFGDAPIAAHPGLWSALDRFPKSTWNADSSWRTKLAEAADELAAMLQAGQPPVPRTVAAWHLVRVAVDDAASMQAEDPEQIAEDNAAIPANPNDYDWAACRTRLLGNLAPEAPEQSQWFTRLPRRE